MLVGIVLRGSAFVFRQYGGGGASSELVWGRVFAVASTTTPVFLGTALGAITNGGNWLSPFPLCVGLFALALFAMLAAVYLTVEADDEALRSDFRARALSGTVAAAVLAFITGWVAPRPFVLRSAAFAFVLAGVGLLAALWVRRFRLARPLAVVMVGLVIGGWGLEEYPMLWPPDLTVQSAAAPGITLHLLLYTLGVGAVVLFPSLLWLLRVFKPGNSRGVRSQ
jgi:cytochrome d ubiquinol oxidase subunit II